MLTISVDAFKVERMWNNFDLIKNRGNLRIWDMADEGKMWNLLYYLKIDEWNQFFLKFMVIKNFFKFSTINF